jgi:hypothetical protein
MIDERSRYETEPGRERTVVVIVARDEFGRAIG